MSRAPKWPPGCQIKRDDLTHLEKLHHLLHALNDPLVSRSKLNMLIAAIPALASRIVHQAQMRWPSVDSLASALQRVGNRGLEQVLLEFLEDLTMYKAEVEAAEAEHAEAEPAAANDAGMASAGASSPGPVKK